MAKGKCRCPPPPAEIPKWFMTYSDVITLLMTFFILLLTFASSEPENFQKMQIVTFGGTGSSGGGTGSTGLLGPAAKGVDKTSQNVRYRPRAARRTMRGSETPPTEIAAAHESAAKGLEALNSLHDLSSAQRVTMVSPVEDLRGQDGRMTLQATEQMGLLAMQMRTLPLSADFQVSSPEDIEFAVGMARYMQDQLNVPSGRLSVSTGSGDLPRGAFRITMTRQSDAP